MNKSIQRCVGLSCVVAAVLCCGGASGGTRQNWKDITASGSWSDGMMWSSGTAPDIGSTNTFQSESLLTGLTTVSIPAEGVGPVGFYNQAFMFPCDGGMLLLKGEGEAPTKLAVNFAWENFFCNGRVALEDVDLDFTEVPNRLIFGAQNVSGAYTTWLLGTGASMRFPTLQDVLLGGDNVPGFCLVLEPGSVCEGGNFCIGRGLNTWGAVVMRGGEFRPASAVVGQREDAFGVIEMFGGNLVLPEGQSLSLGLLASGAGAMYVHGDANAEFPRSLNVGAAGKGELFVDGGLVTVGILSVVNRSTDEKLPGEADGVVTVAGNGRLRFSTFQAYGNLAYAGRSQVLMNLREGGELIVASSAFARPETSGGGLVRLSFDGGLLTRVTNNPDGDDALTTFRGMDLVLHKGGAYLQATTSAGAPTNLHLSRFGIRAATGYGVSKIAVTEGGAGYVMPPLVTISGGSGSNATAVAQVDYETRTVTNVVVTCAGEGYAADDVLTVSFRAATGDNSRPPLVAAATCTLAANEAGPVTLVGGTTLTVDGDVSIPGDLLVDSESAVDLPGNLTVAGDVVLTGAGSVRVAGNAVVAGSVRAPKGAVVFLGADSSVAGDVQAAAYECGGLVVTGAYERVGANIRLGGPEASETVLRTLAAQSLGELTLGTGRVRLEPAAALSFASLADRAPGALLYWDDALSLKPTFGEKPASVGTGDILPGGLVANDKGEVTGGLVKWDEANKTFAAVTAGAEGSMALASDTTIPDGQVVGSGMVVIADGGGKTVAGGTLTSGNGRDLVIQDMAHATDVRYGSSAATQINTKLVDGAADKPTRLVLSGYKDATWIGKSGNCAVTIGKGSYVELANAANSYSGGTQLNDCTLRVSSDACLGAVPEKTCTNIWVTGLSHLKGYNWDVHPLVLAETRGIHIAEGAMLMTVGSIYSNEDCEEKTALRICGPLSGRGALVSGPWGGGGNRLVTELSGDMSDFAGTLSCMCQLRVDDAGKIGPKTRIHFWGATSGVLDESAGCAYGVAQLETCGVIDKTVGFQEGGVAWCMLEQIVPDAAARDATAWGPGGFAAVGGPLTVTLRPPAGTAVLRWGSNNVPGTPGFIPNSNGQLNLQNEASTDVLTWTADLDVAAEAQLSWSAPFMRQIMIGRRNPNAVVKWTGNLLNSQNGLLSVVGCGTWYFSGNAHVAPSVWMYSRAASLGADTDGRVVIDGKLEFTANNRPQAGFTMRSDAGTGVCELNNAANALHGLKVESGTLEINGSTASTNLVIAAAGTLSGSGALTVDGPATVDGAIAVDANASSTLVTVNGDVVFGAESQIVPTDLTKLSKTTSVPVMTWTGNATGCPKVSSEKWLSKWQPHIVGKTLFYQYTPSGVVLIVR